MAPPRTSMRWAVLLTTMAAAVAQTCTPLVPGCICQTRGLSADDYDAIVAPLHDHIVASVTPRRGRIIEDFVGGVVRLAFHDAGEYDPNSSDSFRVDGCVNLENSDNAGLAEVIAQVDVLWSPVCHLVSRADYWVLAAKLSVEITSPTPVTLPFSYGRTDTPSCE